MENSLYPNNIKNVLQLRPFVKYVLLNSDFPNYKKTVSKILYNSFIPKDITGIIFKYTFCSSQQWEKATEEWIKIYGKDLEKLDFFILFVASNKIYFSL